VTSAHPTPVVGHRVVPLVASLVVGMLTALQARINGQLSVELGNGLEAALVSFGSGLVILTVLALLVPSIRRGIVRIPRAVQGGQLRWWQASPATP